MAWPKSLPDYQWPARSMTSGTMPMRLAMACLFHLAYALGRVCSLLTWKRNRVLVIRTDGMGDMLLFEPALEAIARAVSPRTVDVWAPKLSCELLTHCPSIRNLAPLPRGFKSGNLEYFSSMEWRVRLGFRLGLNHFDQVIYPSESPEPLGNWLFMSARAKDRWINFGDTINQFDWQQKAAHLSATRVVENRPGNAHELVRNSYFAEQWIGERSLRTPRLHYTEAIIETAQQRVDEMRHDAKALGGAELIGCVPAGSMAINSYPDLRWMFTMQILWQEYRTVPVLLGGPGDAAALENLSAIFTRQRISHLRMPARLGVLEMAAMIGKLDALISVDTGLAHFAVAQDIPSIVLVGGGNPGRFFPWPDAQQHVALTMPTDCHGCNNRCTMAESTCVTHIEPQQIADAYARIKGRRERVEVYVATSERRTSPLTRNEPRVQNPAA